MADIFKQMGLPPIEEWEMDPEGFRMKGAGKDQNIDPERGFDEDELDIPVELHPEVEVVMKQKVSEDLEKSGIKKSDPRHVSLLDIELALRLAQAEEDHPGMQNSIRNARIREIRSMWGAKAPKILQALGLTYKDAPKPTSKADILLKYLRAKEASKQQAEEDRFKKSMLQTNLDMKKMALEDKLLKSKIAREEKAEKAKTSGFDKEIESDISEIKAEVRQKKKYITDMSGYETIEKIEGVKKDIDDLNLAKRKLFQTMRTKDLELKKARKKEIDNFLEEVRKGGY